MLTNYRRGKNKQPGIASWLCAYSLRLLLACSLAFAPHCFEGAEACDGDLSLDPENGCTPYPLFQRAFGDLGCVERVGDGVLGICDYQAFSNIGKDERLPLSATYKITRNLDASASCKSPFALPEEKADCENPDPNIQGASPIGSASIPFTGSLDALDVESGEIYSIRNLYINLAENEEVGLFGRIGQQGKVSHLILDSPRIKGKQKVGALVGRNQGRVESVAILSPEVQGEEAVGAIAGELTSDGSVAKSFVVEPRISGEASVGAVAGLLDEGGRLLASYVSKGQIALNSNKTEASIGGLVGLARQGSGIKQSYVEGLVIQVHNQDTDDAPTAPVNAGGLVGKLSGAYLQESYVDLKGLHVVRNNNDSKLAHVVGLCENVQAEQGQIELSAQVSKIYYSEEASRTVAAFGSNTVDGCREEVYVRSRNYLRDELYEHATAGPRAMAWDKQDWAQLSLSGTYPCLKAFLQTSDFCIDASPAPELEELKALAGVQIDATKQDSLHVSYDRQYVLSWQNSSNTDAHFYYYIIARRSGELDSTAGGAWSCNFANNLGETSGSYMTWPQESLSSSLHVQGEEPGQCYRYVISVCNDRACSESVSSPAVAVPILPKPDSILITEKASFDDAKELLTSESYTHYATTYKLKAPLPGADTARVFYKAELCPLASLESDQENPCVTLTSDKQGEIEVDHSSERLSSLKQYTLKVQACNQGGITNERYERCSAWSDSVTIKSWDIAYSKPSMSVQQQNADVKSDSKGNYIVHAGSRYTLQWLVDTDGVLRGLSYALLRQEGATETYFDLSAYATDSSYSVPIQISGTHSHPIGAQVRYILKICYGDSRDTCVDSETIQVLRGLPALRLVDAGQLRGTYDYELRLDRSEFPALQTLWSYQYMLNSSGDWHTLECRSAFAANHPSPQCQRSSYSQLDSIRIPKNMLLLQSTNTWSMRVCLGETRCQDPSLNHSIANVITAPPYNLSITQLDSARKYRIAWHYSGLGWDAAKQEGFVYELQRCHVSKTVLCDGHDDSEFQNIEQSIKADHYDLSIHPFGRYRYRLRAYYQRNAGGDLRKSEKSAWAYSYLQVDLPIVKNPSVEENGEDLLRYKNAALDPQGNLIYKTQSAVFTLSFESAAGVASYSVEECRLELPEQERCSDSTVCASSPCLIDKGADINRKPYFYRVRSCDSPSKNFCSYAFLRIPSNEKAYIQNEDHIPQAGDLQFLAGTHPLEKQIDCNTQVPSLFSYQFQDSQSVTSPATGKIMCSAGIAAKTQSQLFGDITWKVRKCAASNCGPEREQSLSFRHLQLEESEVQLVKAGLGSAISVSWKAPMQYQNLPDSAYAKGGIYTLLERCKLDVRCEEDDWEALGRIAVHKNTSSYSYEDRRDISLSANYQYRLALCSDYTSRNRPDPCGPYALSSSFSLGSSKPEQGKAFWESVRITISSQASLNGEWDLDVKTANITSANANLVYIYEIEERFDLLDAEGPTWHLSPWKRIQNQIIISCPSLGNCRLAASAPGTFTPADKIYSQALRRNNPGYYSYRLRACRASIGINSCDAPDDDVIDRMDWIHSDFAIAFLVPAPEKLQIQAPDPVSGVYTVQWKAVKNESNSEYQLERKCTGACSSYTWERQSPLPSALSGNGLYEKSYTHKSHESAKYHFRIRSCKKYNKTTEAFVSLSSTSSDVLLICSDWRNGVFSTLDGSVVEEPAIAAIPELAQAKWLAFEGISDEAGLAGKNDISYDGQYTLKWEVKDDHSYYIATQEEGSSDPLDYEKVAGGQKLFKHWDPDAGKTNRNILTKTYVHHLLACAGLKSGVSNPGVCTTKNSSPWSRLPSQVVQKSVSIAHMPEISGQFGADTRLVLDGAFSLHWERGGDSSAGVFLLEKRPGLMHWGEAAFRKKDSHTGKEYFVFSAAEPAQFYVLPTSGAVFQKRDWNVEEVFLGNEMGNENREHMIFYQGDWQEHGLGGRAPKSRDYSWDISGAKPNVYQYRLRACSGEEADETRALQCSKATVAIAVYFDGTQGDGSQAKPYQIGNYFQLKALRHKKDAHYVLLRDIDASESCGGNCADPKGIGWMPVGSASLPFSGSLDGAKHSIINLYVRSSKPQLGLFGFIQGKLSNDGLMNCLDNASIQSLSLENVIVHSMQAQSSLVHLAPLAGELFCAVVDELSLKGTALLAVGTKHSDFSDDFHLFVIPSASLKMKRTGADSFLVNGMEIRSNTAFSFLEDGTHKEDPSLQARPGLPQLKVRTVELRNGALYLDDKKLHINSDASYVKVGELLLWSSQASLQESLRSGRISNNIDVNFDRDLPSGAFSVQNPSIVIGEETEEAPSIGPAQASHAYAGALAGRMRKSILRNSFVNGALRLRLKAEHLLSSSADTLHVGMLAASVEDGSVLERSFTRGSIALFERASYSSLYLGAITGANSQFSIIRDVYARIAHIDAGRRISLALDQSSHSHIGAFIGQQRSHASSEYAYAVIHVNEAIVDSLEPIAQATSPVSNTLYVSDSETVQLSDFLDGASRRGWKQNTDAPSPHLLYGWEGCISTNCNKNPLAGQN